MMVKIRDLVNSKILNGEDKWVGFFGDSEYLDDNSDVRFGYWSFIAIDRLEEIKMEHYVLDDFISEKEFCRDEVIVYVRNDNDTLCIVKLYYKER